MSTKIFLDKLVKPDDKKLAEVLGASAKLWKEIKDYVTAEYGGVTEEWKYYGAKIGWTLKSLYKKRNLFFFTPYQKWFRISFVFGDKAVTVIEKSDLPKTIIEEVRNARKYAEGRGLPIEVKTRSDVENIKKLIEIKINN